MKEFVVSELVQYLAIADHIDTPFKFLETNENTNGEHKIYELKATVWMRTAFLTFEDVLDKDGYVETRNILHQHGFAEATIREAPITLR